MRQPIRLDPKKLYQQMQAIEGDRYSTTPAAITPEIRKFAERLNGKPTFVPVVEEAISAFHDCFATVGRRVKDQGGQIVVGWTIWEWPTMFLDAEHHAVWRDPEGKLIDIARKQHSERRILFVPDPKRPHEGIRIDNKRMPLRDHWTVRDFIGVAQEMFEVMGPSVGMMKVTQDMMKLQMYQSYLELEMRKLTLRELVETARQAAQQPPPE